MLKIHLQPVMDQIKNKYKKFRTPIIDESHILYLYDDQEPDFPVTDLTPEQIQEQALMRPYKLDKDKHGVPGLREIASGKFFYNLEIVIIEKRLSNGYYKRPSEFLGDIKRIAKDANTSGDAERTLKANEMLANVEVDMQFIESQHPALVAECEAVTARELAREREALEKANKAAAAQGQGTTVPNLASDAAPHSLTTETTGPVMLGEPIPGQNIMPITPENRRAMQTQLSNGDSGNGDGSHAHEQSNGSTVPSRPVDEDVPMQDSQDVPATAPHPRTHTMPSFFTPSGPNTQPRSQQSGILRMASGTQPGDYQNSASTTTSGQKTSDRSNRTSDRSNFNNTQSTNGASHGIFPDFSTVPAMSGGSQIPDTQGRFLLPHASINNSFDSVGSSESDAVSIEATFPSSQQTGSQASQGPRPDSQFAYPSLPSQRQSQPQAANAGNPTSIDSLLNASEPKLLLDEVTLLALHGQLVKRTSGLSVEQLEQVNATLMDAVWRHRMKWNRNLVISAVQESFNEVIKDIEEIQAILGPTQSTPGQA